MVVGMVTCASAEMTLEYDFRAEASGTTATASYAKPGSSDQGTLASGVSISTGANGGIPSGFDWIDAVKYGALSVPDGARGMQIAGANGKFNNYFDTSPYFYSGGALIMVFKPDYDGTPSRRTHLFAHYGDGDNGMCGDAHSVAIYTGDGMSFWVRVGGYGTEVDPWVSVAWDSTKWYFIAASWQAGSPATAYVRELGTSAGSFGASGDNVTTEGWYYQNLWFGVRPDNLNDKTARGTFSLLRMYDTYMNNQAAFDELYDGLIVVPVQPPRGTVVQVR